MKLLMSVCILLFTGSLIGEVRVSWIGNTYGGADDQWVQNFIDGMFVASDGTVFLTSGWDEGGGEAGIYRDGERLGHLPDTHGWGRFASHAITADERYIYLSMVQSGCDGGDADALNSNGLNQYPPCDEEGEGPIWLSVRRHDRETFEVVPFPQGYGVDGGQLIVEVVPAGEEDLPLTGLAILEGELFVSSPYTDQVKVYDTEALTLQREFEVDQPNEIAIGPDGDLWILQRYPVATHTHSEESRITRYSPQGERRQQTIAFDQTAQPTALVFDGKGRLWITDNGIRQQVLIYDHLDDEPRLVDTFGVEGGIYSGVAGVVAPLKFYDLQAIGFDAEGHIYIGMGSARSGSHLQSYTPAGELRWEVQGLLFVDSLGIDPTSDGAIVYGKHERFALDYTVNQPGQEAQYLAYTLDPFRYPDDPRNFSSPTDVFVQVIDGQRFLYMTDMYTSYIAIYRFNAETDGEIAIPSGLIAKESIDWIPGIEGQPENSAVIWRDLNGNGGFDAGEIEGQADPQDTVYTWGWWIDTDGTIWRANREYGIRSFPLQGLDEVGNPIYTFASSILEPNPAPFDAQEGDTGDINRLIYLPETDTLYLTGYTARYPNDADAWGELGRVIVRYDSWSSGDRVPDWELVPKWSPDESPIGLDIAGAYLFLAYTYPQPSHVLVYSARDGQLVTRFAPDETVGEDSGWFDIRYLQRANGEYVVFAEEDARAKNLIYRWQP